jgi:hypothetical protein
MQNILVDGDGKIPGIVDWEFVSAPPLWRACELPGFLKGRDRKEEPKRDQYVPDKGENSVGLTKEVLNNEGVNSLYWEHLLEYELTMLRDLFLKEIGMSHRDGSKSWRKVQLKLILRRRFKTATIAGV